MSDKLDHHNFSKRFRNVLGESGILVTLLKMYVQHSAVADHLIFVVPGI